MLKDASEAASATRQREPAWSRTLAHLADGREIAYYWSSATPPAVPSDERRLPRIARASSLRYDPLQQRWVIYAAQRQDRSHLPGDDECPLCPSTPAHRTEVPAPDYEVVVFENRFPALGVDAPGTGRSVPERAGISSELAGTGRCEVVCYSPAHDADFAGLSAPRVRLVLEALIDRTRVLSARDDVEQVFCFENRGREIGVTQLHPHGQIYGYPFVAPRLAQALAAARRYVAETGCNLFDELVAAECRDGRRLVLESEHFVAFVPFAARWPFEVHCYPRRRVPDLAALDEDERGELPEVLLDLFGRFASLFHTPAPYIAAWHQAPVRTGRELFACHLELFTTRRADDKLKYLAGSESAMDAFASDVLPEDAAARLRALATR